MTEHTALAAAITALSTAIANLQPRADPPPVFDPFAEDKPFNLSTRQGAQSYSEASSPLDEIWDGCVNTFPSFIINLQIRANEAKWNGIAPHDITKINGKDIFSDYHSISDTEISTERAARTDTRALQNATTMFKCIKSSVAGNVKETIFTQNGNLPSHNCGVTLLKELTTLTSVSSLQLSLLAFSNILQFNPVDFEFDVPKINTKLTQLFTLAATQHRNINDLEKIQHTLNVYGKIMQPELWAQWVRNKFDEFENGSVTNSQDFMNSATIKYNKVSATSGGKFNGSIHTVQEDVIALLSTKSKSRTFKCKQDNDDNDNNESPTQERKHEAPDFLYHYKDGTTNQNYKVGDKKEFNGTTFYFCDAPWHKKKAKWHTHTAEKCRVRKNWLKSNKGKDKDDDASQNRSNPEANVADTDSSANDTPNDSTSFSDVTALLASAMNLVSDNDAVRDQIAEALNLIALE